jgi:Tir chaperone protein (CesT) family
MSYDRFTGLVEQLCGAIGLPDPAAVIERRVIEVEGFTVILDYIETDPRAMYLQFDFGIATSGRTLRIFRLMLESNLLIYAQDQAQLGLDPESGAVLLIMRVPFSRDLDGQWLAETLGHYAEHGRYWRNHLLEAPDDEFNGLAQGNFAWIKA